VVFFAVALEAVSFFAVAFFAVAFFADTVYLPPLRSRSSPGDYIPHGLLRARGSARPGAVLARRSLARTGRPKLVRLSPYDRSPARWRERRL
jgi:hypothetical protein